ncbi:MAG: UDP-N-acetyl-alpha-D-glucosamine C6 dehydratase [Acidobacteria bacterium ADurb.Bin340]|nr:MAG: UDP-N-acetyl-alpha-D-glucosamine C6 dehydratase [Acidobacteria bacterium ADurb.Bin340]
MALDLQAIGRELHDRVVLITGAGGSIGSELARQVATFSPARIVLLGRGEFSLWEVERELRARQPGLPIAIELCDIRNAVRLGQVFRQWKPQVVFHAAAHKHVPYLESHPEEALENNALGTYQVVTAALENGCQTLVNISTDKAVSPANLLGASKRLAEMIVEAAANLGGERRRFVSVRFGNVLGSRGSVVPLFREQIRRGGPVTVTHPDMTRFFMTIPEASQLVLQAGLLGDSGRVYVLDMGDPVRILDLAEDMIRLSGLKPGEDIEIVHAGIRPGEKLHEELFQDLARVEPTDHPKVSAALPEAFDWSAAEAWAENLRQILALPDTERRPAILAFIEETLPDWSPAQAEKGAAWVDLTTRFNRDASGPWKTLS